MTTRDGAVEAVVEADTRQDPTWTFVSQISVTIGPGKRKIQDLLRSKDIIGVD